MDEQEQLARARRHLIIVGVSCMAVVIGLLWIVNLKRTLTDNRLRYLPIFRPFHLETTDPQQIQKGWREFRGRIKTLKTN